MKISPKQSFGVFYWPIQICWTFKGTLNWDALETWSMSKEKLMWKLLKLNELLNHLFDVHTRISRWTTNFIYCEVCGTKYSINKKLETCMKEISKLKWKIWYNFNSEMSLNKHIESLHGFMPFTLNIWI